MSVRFFLTLLTFTVSRHTVNSLLGIRVNTVRVTEGSVIESLHNKLRKDHNNYLQLLIGIFEGQSRAHIDTSVIGHDVSITAYCFIKVVRKRFVAKTHNGVFRCFACIHGFPEEKRTNQLTSHHRQEETRNCVDPHKIQSEDKPNATKSFSSPSSPQSCISLLRKTTFWQLPVFSPSWRRHPIPRLARPSLQSQTSMWSSMPRRRGTVSQICHI